MSSRSEEAEQILIQKTLSVVSKVTAFCDITKVSVQRLPGGCSNQLFACVNTCTGEKVVCRWYGSDLTGEGNNHKPVTEEIEARVMARLSSGGLYHRILLVFPGGRIEEFVDGRIPTIREINSFDLNLLFMRKLAAIHSIRDMPLDYEKAMFSFSTFHKYLRDLEARTDHQVEEDGSDRQAFDAVSGFDMRAECQWLQQEFSFIDSRIVFCHNDLHKDNILLTETVTCVDDDGDQDSDNNNNDKDSKTGIRSMRIMDFEYSSCNFRWADLSIHLTEMSFQSYDHINDRLTVGPVESSFVRKILSCYLDEWRLLSRDGNHDDEDDDDDGRGLDSLDHVEQEVRFGCLIIHFARVLFFCAYVGRNYGPMQNWKYTRTRMTEYLRAKDHYLKYK